MITKEKALYQVKLIIESLSEDEYSLIPEATLDYIDSHYEYDETFMLDPSLPFEKQVIDEEAYKILEKIFSDIESKSDDEIQISMPQIGFDDNIFKNNNETATINNQNNEIMKYKESLLTRIINKLFHKK